jgi:hypothetical protein
MALWCDFVSSHTNTKIYKRTLCEFCIFIVFGCFCWHNTNKTVQTETNSLHFGGSSIQPNRQTNRILIHGNWGFTTGTFSSASSCISACRHTFASHHSPLVMLVVVFSHPHIKSYPWFERIDIYLNRENWWWHFSGAFFGCWSWRKEGVNNSRESHLIDRHIKNTSIW